MALPTESKPEAYVDTLAGERVKTAIQQPEAVIPESARQTYTEQAVKPEETMRGFEQAAAPQIGAAGISAPTLAAAPGMTTTGVAPVRGVQTGTYQAATTGAAPQVTAAAGQVTAPMTAAQGQITGPAAAATGAVKAADLTTAAQGQVSSDAIMQAATDTNFGQYTINQVPQMAAAQMETVKGTAAEGVAAQTDIEAAKRTLDYGDAAANAAVANLPQEALVTTQLNNLLSAMEQDQMPAWAQPALSQVESVLAARGMGKSSIGRDALFNAVIQAAVPLAQSNATALQQRAQQNLANQQQVNVLNAQLQQERGMAEGTAIANFLSQNTQLTQQMNLANLNNRQQMEMANLEYQFQTNRENMTATQQANLENMRAELQVAVNNSQVKTNLGLANLSNKQQAALTNAQIAANMDITNLGNRQQAALANSQFMQTMSMQNLNNQQQAAILNATNMASMDMANLNANQQAQAENAKAFLAMDMANLTNAQQAAVINQQTRQQFMLSDQAAQNAALQFNAANTQQTAQFMANLNSSIQLNNAARADAASQYNSQLAQQRAAINAGNQLAAAQYNAQAVNAVNQFNAQLAFNRDQFNTQNAIAIEQSNVQWRRQVNTANTAGINAVNQANAINAFNLSNQALSFAWQENRDAANWAFQASQNAEDQKTRLAIAALGNEAATDQAKMDFIIQAGNIAYNLWSNWGTTSVIR
jgi:hypothetical protein